MNLDKSTSEEVSLQCNDDAPHLCSERGCINKTKINHLLDMDDFELFEKKKQNEIQNADECLFSKDTRMLFGVKKCAIIVLKKFDSSNNDIILENQDTKNH